MSWSEALPACPDHQHSGAAAGDCEVCDCLWLLSNEAAEDPRQTAQDLARALEEKALKD